MLSYQHAYHAGNFADVHKHLTLFCVLQHLLRKKTPVTYIDTHAGRGRYPLAASETQKVKEYQQGIAPLWQARTTLSRSTPLLEAWLAALQRAQTREGRHLTDYPGSPWWLADSLRDHDRLGLFELHPGEHQHLEAQVLPNNVRRVQGDGLAALRRMLPVNTPRLCALIDPSYERKSDYLDVADTLAFVARKARHAVVLVWYPLLPAGRHESLLEATRRAGIHKLWRSELRHHAPGIGEHGMHGSGMLLFNPPWGVEPALGDAMQAILPHLGREASHHSDWWVGEE